MIENEVDFIDELLLCDKVVKGVLDDINKYKEVTSMAEDQKGD